MEYLIWKGDQEQWSMNKTLIELKLKMQIFDVNKFACNSLRILTRRDMALLWLILSLFGGRDSCLLPAGARYDQVHKDGPEFESWFSK